jgi:leader peptidase (prepilin peptidase)/N-methyltransferase
MVGYGLLGFVLGIVINHLANVLPGHRSPLEAPRCPDCEQETSPLQWSGLIAYLTGRRRCTGCDRPIPLRAPVVEVLTGLVFAYLFHRYGPSAQLGAFSFFALVFILTAVTDLEHRLILNAAMYPAIAIAIVLAFFRPDITYKQSLVGGLTGLVLVLLIYLAGPLFVRVWGRMRGRTTAEVPFGFGDVTLALFIGLAVGFPAVVFALFIGIFAGGLGAITFILIRILGQGKYKSLSVIPYGPFLILGGALMMLYGASIMSGYLGSYS